MFVTENIIFLCLATPAEPSKKKLRCNISINFPPVSKITSTVQDCMITSDSEGSSDNSFWGAVAITINGVGGHLIRTKIMV